jgi:hypothetical protein
VSLTLPVARFKPKALISISRSMVERWPWVRTTPGLTALQINSGTLGIDLGFATEFGTVSATGNVTLGGHLRIRLADGFEPQPDDAFASH